MIARQPRRAYAFIGALNGKPVGASVLYLDAGVAGLYDVGVLPEARRQGIGAAMTVAPLRFARELGYRYGVLQASGMGVPVYERVGFRKVCRISCWYHSKTQQAKDSGPR
jgi:GNAT superfamily N-acetyltransferase